MLKYKVMATGSDELRDVIDDYLRRRAAGETVSEADVIRRHPQLQPQLEVELRRAEMIAAAREKALFRGNLETPRSRSPAAATPLSANGRSRLPAATDRNAPPQADSPGLHIHCPRCHRRIDTPADAEWHDLQCSHCGNAFSLTGDATESEGFAPGHRIGHFELLAKLGEGGFGTVWTARDTELDRLVAVKMPRRGSLSTHDADLFLREARAAAQLHHPNIVAVHEVGRDGDTIYIVSELVHGVSLADWAHGPLPPRQAAALGETIARALHHAHSAGVIHRDLKPSNILIDAAGQPHLADFGLAKRDSAETTRTATGQMLGTPAYMSPEQARGAAHDCTARSDVYSLGVVLYELLTGEVPFRGNARMVLAKILDEEPPSPRRFVPEVPPELETICLKCMEKDPARRYPTAAALADDLQRHLAGRAIDARPIGRLERGWRWCRRKPIAATLAGVLALLAFVGPLVAWRQTQLANEADLARHTAEAADRRTYRQLYLANMAAIPRAMEERDYARAIQLLEAHLPTPGREDVRGLEWFHWWKYCHRGLLRTHALPHALWSIALSPDERTAAVILGGRRIGLIDVATGALTAEFGESTDDLQVLVYSRDSQSLYAGYRSGTLRIWNLASRAAVTRTAAHASPINDIAIAPDGTVLSCDDDGHVKSWNAALEQGQSLLSVRDGAACRSLAVSPDGRYVAVAATLRQVLIRDPITFVALYRRADAAKQHEFTLPVTESRQVLFSPDGKWLAAAGGTSAPRLWEVASGSALPPLADCRDTIAAIAFSSDSKTLAGVPGHGGGAYLWNLTTRKLDPFFAAHPNVSGVAWRARDRELLTIGKDQRLRVWSPRDYSPPERLLGQLGNVAYSSLSHDGSTLVTESSLDLTSVFDLPARKLRRTLPLLVQPIVTSDGRSLAAVRGDNTVVLVDLVGNAPLRELFVSQHKIGSLKFTPDGRTLLIGENASRRSWTAAAADLLTVNLAPGSTVQRLDRKIASVSVLACTPDGQHAVAALHGGTLNVYDLNTRQRRHVLKSLQPEAPSPVSCLACRNDLVAVGTLDGTTLLVDLATGRTRQRFASFGGRVNAVAFTPDGQTLATAIGNFDGAQGAVRLWDVATGESKGAIVTDRGPVRDLLIAPDGRTLITGHGVHTLLVWPGATDQEVAQQTQ